jgi:hypothetical protein
LVIYIISFYEILRPIETSMVSVSYDTNTNSYSFNRSIGLSEDEIFTRIIYYLLDKSQSSITPEQSFQ